MTRRRLAALPVLLALSLSLAACNADTEPATEITQTSAKLSANVDWEQNEDVVYWFEYRRLGTSPWIRDDIRDPGTLGGTGRDVKISEQVSGSPRAKPTNIASADTSPPRTPSVRRQTRSASTRTAAPTRPMTTTA